MPEVIRTDKDEPVANGDLEVDEPREEMSTGDDEGISEPTEAGLEDVADVEAARGLGPQGEAALADDADVDRGVVDLTGLRDAGEASFDVIPRAESVITPDERRRISPASDYPWRVHCALRITARDGSQWIGTAFFIGPRVLATAGHNVFFRGPVAARRGWARQIEVMPGRDGDSLPYGRHVATRFYSVRGWTEDGDDEWDYGAIVLGTAVGSRTGWLGYASYRDSTLTNKLVNLSGYPGDLGNGTEQWYMADRISSLGSRKVYYPIDTFGGQSGSAVYRIVDGHRYAVGIHAYGVDSTGFNSATRINRPVFDNLKAWKAAHP